MKKVFAILLTTLLSLTFVVPIYAANLDSVVYISNTGKEYHTKDCKSLTNGTPVALQYAVITGYAPCSLCNPAAPTSAYNVSGVTDQLISAAMQQQLLLQQQQAAQLLAAQQAALLQQTQAAGAQIAVTPAQPAATTAVAAVPATADQQAALLAQQQAALLALQAQAPSKDVMAVQSKLKLYGLYDGTASGILDAKTQNAIKVYQISYGLPVDGTINPQIKFLLAN